MVGSALVRRLAGEDCEILTAGREVADLRRQRETERLFDELRPNVVILAAAHVGGIMANSGYPAEFLYDNLMIAANVVEASRRAGVAKLVFLGSSCIYPKHAPQPISEDALLSGPLEPTNQWYAVAKIAGIKLTEAYRRQFGSDFIALQPANLYGPGDNFDPATSHVMAALVRRFHEAKRAGKERVLVWGSGTPRREFLHVDDLAEACMVAIEKYSDESPLNVGSGTDLTIAELATLISETVGYRGGIEFDPSKPDGTPRKLLNSARIRALGWEPRVHLRKGIGEYYASFLETSDAEGPSADAA
jgi:GDP-L-fucose synthase